MQVLDHQDERPVDGQRREETGPRRERFLLWRCRRLRLQAGERCKPIAQPRMEVRIRLGDHGIQLPPDRRLVVRLHDPR